jgi:ribosomal protein L29
MSNLVKLSEKDLVKTLFEKREALRQFRFGTSGSKTRNVKEGRNLRREIARILTEINKRKAHQGE